MSTVSGMGSLRHLLLHSLGPQLQDVVGVDLQISFVQRHFVCVGLHHGNHHVFELCESRAKDLLLRDAPHNVLGGDVRRHVAHEILERIADNNGGNVSGDLFSRLLSIQVARAGEIHDESIYEE
jgi:hypothetical protein